MAEWSIAAVLKTVDLPGSGGSNPSLSATQKQKTRTNVRVFLWKEPEKTSSLVFLGSLHKKSDALLLFCFRVKLPPPGITKHAVRR